MEPSGVMDRPTATTTNEAKYTICDLADDEEVHFSKDSSDYYYCYQTDKSVASKASSSKHYQSGRPASAALPVGGAKFVSSYNHVAANNQAISGTYINDENSMQSSDQVKSSRLLHTIGSRLRRGSNYLVAPKLVGEYLLGITIQSWAEFLDTSRMLKAPTNRHVLQRRLINNLNHFQGNYLCVSLVLIVYCILTSPLLLLAIVGYLLTLYLVTARSALGKQTRLMGYRLNLQQQYSCITMISLPLLWVAGAPSAVFWVIGASFFVVGLHASMFANEKVQLELAHQKDHNYNMINGHRPSVDAITSERYKGTQYYNHYSPKIQSPTTSLGGYSSVSQSATFQQIDAAVPLNANHGTSYMPHALSQWISFVSSGSGGGGNGVHVGKHVPTTNETSSQSTRIPEVKVISQDYAGLGRVYEV